MLYLAALLMTAPALDVRDAAARVLGDPSYQTRLPPERPARGAPDDDAIGDRPGSRGDAGDAGTSPGTEQQRSAPAPSPPADPRSGEARADQPRPAARELRVPSLLQRLARDALWALLAVALIVLAVFGGRAWAASRQLSDGDGAAAAGPKRRTRARRAAAQPGEWQALARRQRYDEAIHLLLLDALARLPSRAGASLAASWTSREVLSGARLSGEPRDALSRLVEAVELSRFGRRPADEALFVSCCEDHQRLGRSG